MTSLVVMPSARRRAMYFWVGSCQRRRTTTARCRAALACRFPPRLSRCRLVLPEDAGIGLAPHRAAKAASECSRSGLSPAAVRKVAAPSGPTPVIAVRAGAARSVSRRRWVFIWLASLRSCR